MTAKFGNVHQLLLLMSGAVSEKVKCLYSIQKNIEEKCYLDSICDVL